MAWTSRRRTRVPGGGRIGYVSQDTLLFHDSVRANLLWAKPEATDAELAEALTGASAEFVYELARESRLLSGIAE